MVQASLATFSLLTQMGDDKAWGSVYGKQMDITGKETSQGKRADVSTLSHRDLIERFCKDRENQELATELWHRFGSTIREALKYQASLRPYGYDDQTFLDSCWSQAYINFFRRICQFQFKGPIEAWLYKLASTTALDERRTLTGRAKKPRREVGLEQAGEPEDQSFRSKHYPLRSRLSIDPVKKMSREDRKSFVRELLVQHAEASDRDLESARTIRLRYWKKLPVAQVAASFHGEPQDKKQRAARERAVYRTLESNYTKLGKLLEEAFGVTSLREI